MRMTSGSRGASSAWAAAALVLFAIPDCGRAAADNASPFGSLPGRWSGEGRLGFTDGKSEAVKCRVTYILAETVNQLKQTIRCGSTSGKVEVQSLVTEQAGQLTGTWSERVHNLDGELTGQVTKFGFRVTAKGGDFAANMDIIVKGVRQVVEIKFQSSALIGLTLALTKDGAGKVAGDN